MLRQKFLSGLDLKLKNKVRYKEFKDYEDLVRETDKYNRRLEAEKEESSKKEFVNAITTAKSSSDTQLIWTAIEKQNEVINAITTGSRIVPQMNESVAPPAVGLQDDITQKVAIALSNLLQTAQLPPIRGNPRPQVAPQIGQSANFQPRFHQQRPQGPPYQQRQAYPSYRNQYGQPTQPRQILPQQANYPADRPPRSSITCYMCGNKGHYRSECGQRQVGYAQVPAATDERQRMLTCYTCGVVGHRSNTCPNKGANIPALALRQGNA
jgi:hypothetical protein